MSMTDELRIARAEADVEIARERLVSTLQDVTRQLEPRRLIGDLWEDAKSKGADLAEEAVDAVKSRPVAAGSVVAALALYLAREPLTDLASKIGRSFGKKPKQGKTSRKRPKTETETENDPAA